MGWRRIAYVSDTEFFGSLQGSVPSRDCLRKAIITNFRSHFALTVNLNWAHSGYIARQEVLERCVLFVYPVRE
jgi:hypothetical protein